MERKKPAPKGQKTSIGLKVIISILLMITFMLSVLYFAFYNNMLQMLEDREREQIESELLISEKRLTIAEDYLPAILSSWAVWDNAFGFVQGTFDEFLSYNLNAYPYKEFNLDFIAVLDEDGGLIYENFYPHSHSQGQNPPRDFTGAYKTLGPMAVQTAAGTTQTASAAMPQMGVSGFLYTEGQLVYMSVHPILPEDYAQPSNGALVFGRYIYPDELNDLDDAAGTQFFVSDKIGFEAGGTGVALSPGETVVSARGADEISAYKLANDIFGSPSLVFEARGLRTLYNGEMHILVTIMAMLGVFCLLMLAFVIWVMVRIVIRPLSRLVGEVNAVDNETLTPRLSTRHSSREFVFLSQAINQMLGRIKESKDIISQNNEKLYVAATYDELTGLLNRKSFVSTMKTVVKKQAEDDTFLGMYYIDLDRFKFINDTMGFTVGDIFLLDITKRMEERFGRQAYLGRPGGDKFIISRGGFQERYEADLFADEILSLFHEPFTANGRQMNISASIGSSVYPTDATEVETLFKNAEMAMYRAKELGRNLNCRYESQLDKILQRKIYIENKIRASVNQGCDEFKAYLQPKAHAQTGRIVSCEALMRWETPEGIVGPGEFIPLAEESGLIIELSRHMLREACLFNQILLQKGIESVVSVNISAQVLLHKKFAAMIEDAEAYSGMNLRYLDIEITENTVLEDVESVNTVLNNLHERGITVSIDDFGTGYSSLSYLTRLAVDRIKIDQSFIKGLLENDEDRTIVNAIVAMGKSLRMIVTAEGVETLEQYQYLKMLGCEEIQGYFISRPIPPEEYLTFIQNNGCLNC